MQKELSNRMKQLQTQVMERRGSFVEDINPFIHDVAVWKAYKPGRSRVQKRAAYLFEEVRMAPLAIPPLWQLAGEHLPAAGARPYGKCLQKLDKESRKQLDKYKLSKRELKEMKAVVSQWTAHAERRFLGFEWHSIGESGPESQKGIGGWGHNANRFVFWGRGWIENHSIRDFEKVMKIGFKGIRREIENLLETTDRTDPDFPRKENFWRAALMVCDAGILLGERYAKLAEKMAKKTTKQQERQRLLNMAEICRKVPANGAESFLEAVQSLWFSHILTCGEDSINANSLGRLDRILYPFYKKDIDVGVLSRDDALEIMEELACKLYLDYDVQAITLGGQDRDGQNSVNELSYLFLEATDKVGFIRDVSVRLHQKTPQDFIDRCADMIIKGGGIPFIFNDDCFVKALSDRGIALEDARNYAPIGCIELTVPGRANPHAVSGWINSTKCLELAIFGGKDPVSGAQAGPKTPKLTEMESYDEFYDNYMAQLEFFTRNMVYNCNHGELEQMEKGPLPCWSVLTDDCIKRGRDITDGGAVYNYHSICFMGTANTADSLMALKELVFEEGKITKIELMEALKSDFDGFEKHRQLLLKGAPKYGNDCEDVDEIARKVDDDFINLMDQYRSSLGGRYFVHLFSFLCNLSFGSVTGATPDGRKAGEPLAYSLSAQQGRDEKGATAMLKSLSRLPHDKAAGASAAILELSPKMLEGAEGRKRLSQMIQTLIKMKVGQIQFNVVTADRLIQAQNDPEKYGNLSVRVAGFSQMFKLINKDLQDHIIARTKHEF